jgi:LysM repeat protein
LFLISFLLLASICLSSCQPTVTTVSAQTPTEETTPTPTVIVTEEPTATIPDPTQTQAPTPLPTPITHVVVEGDTLWDLSETYGVSIPAITEANNISESDPLFPGTVLIIPSPEDTGLTLADSGKQIEVVLSEQKVYAYDGKTLINEFIVSTGVPAHPTVTGKFYIYRKLDVTRMVGDGYDLPNIHWVMYFFEGYSFHEAYWHNNFGHPMSHGCVNMRLEDAKWLYDWAPLGTPVLVVP